MESLRNLGYVALTIPAADVKPLMLLIKASKGVVQSFGKIDEIWNPTVSRPPARSKDIPMAAFVSGADNLDLKIESNFNFLKALTSLFSADVAAGFNFSKNGAASYQITNPKKVTVSIASLDQFIRENPLRDISASRLKELETGQLYVVTEVIKAKEFVVEVESEVGVSSSLKIPLKQIVDAEGNLVRENEKKSVIRYKGEEFLTFGLKAYKIQRKRGFFSGKVGDFQIDPADDIKVYKGEEHYPGEELTDEFINLQPRK